VLRAELDQANSLRGVVEMARKVALGAYAHQDLPFEKIVEKLAPQRDLSRTPMFQVVFTFRTETAFNAEFGGLQMNSLNVDVGTSKYDLTLSVQPVGESAALMLNYSTDLFNADTITKMLGHYERLLEHMASETGRQRLWDLPMLSREEENQLVWQYRPVNAGADGKTITELFEEQVAMQPQAAAVAWGEDQLSYSELNERANQLGRHLRSKGIGAEDRIGICVERSLDLVVGILGILKAGAAYLPIDYDYPADRIDYMLQDSGAAMLLTQERLSAKLTAKPDLVFCLDRDWPLMESYSRTNLPSLINGENLAYVIYTSGSTGQPKATEVPHRSIAGFIFGVDYASFDPQCVLLQHSSVNWDALTLELWPALLRGGRTVLLPNKIVTGADLRTCIHKYGLNTLWLTSALFNLIVEEDPESLKGIRQLMIGGEALSVPHVKRILRSIPEIRIVNGYGPSECTVFSNCYPIRETPGEDVQSIPIGPAIGDRRVYLLDQWLNPVPVGVMGEIYIGGPSVARGYSNQPVMTAEKFIPDCFSVQPGERLYRTGDLARWKADGNLEFAGRADGQLKIRGRSPVL
jgi:aspartate racemase